MENTLPFHRPVPMTAPSTAVKVTGEGRGRGRGRGWGRGRGQGREWGRGRGGLSTRNHLKLSEHHHNVEEARMEETT